MKHLLYFILLIVTIILSGCSSSYSKPEMYASVTEFLTATSNPTRLPITTERPLPSATHTPHPTQTEMPTIPITLEPEQVEDIIRTFLQEPGNCLAPCFWGILPAQTPLDEAKNIFTHWGLQLDLTFEEGNKKFYANVYEFSDGLTVTSILTIIDNKVKDINIGISPIKPEVGVPRVWSGYSPETLIAQYGTPTKVDFWVDYPGDADAEPKAWYWMMLYFDAVDLIVQYGRPEIKPPLAWLPICPLTDPFDTVQLWLGRAPEYPPQLGISLAEASSLTLEEFAEKMIGDPENACFELQNAAFPQGWTSPPP